MVTMFVFFFPVVIVVTGHLCRVVMDGWTLENSSIHPHITDHRTIDHKSSPNAETWGSSRR